MRRHFRPSKTNPSSSIENVKIEMIDIEPNVTIDSNQKQITIRYKEPNENSESFHEYLEN